MALIESHYLNLSHGRVHVRVAGDRGPAIVLLHGWGPQGASFLEPLQLALAAAGFRTYAPDHPGFAQSDLPHESWNLDRFIRYLEELLSRLNLDSFVLLGHSFGGRMVIKMAAQGHVKPKAIILIDVAGIRQIGVRQLVSMTLAKLGQPLRHIPDFERFGRRILSKIGGSRDDEKAGPLRDTFRAVIREDLTPLLSQIKIPTLILWGKRDKLTPLAHGEIMHKLIAGSKMQVFDGGHMWFRDHSKPAVQFIYQWLQSQ